MPLVLKGEKTLSDIIQNTCIKGLDLAPANIYLDGIEAENPLAMDLYSHEKLRKALYTIEGKYDFIFIDTPPSLGWLTQSALFASRYTIICSTPEPYSMLGLTRLKNYHDKVCENHELSCAGVLFSFWTRKEAPIKPTWKLWKRLSQVKFLKQKSGAISPYPALFFKVSLRS